MNIKEFTEHLQEAFETLEDDFRFTGMYTDAFEVDDDVVEIPFEDGQRFRLTIEKTV